MYPENLGEITGHIGNLQTKMFKFLPKNDYFWKNSNIFLSEILIWRKSFFCVKDNSWLFTLKLNHSLLK